MNEHDKPPQDEHPLLDTLREEVAGGLRYIHTRANANNRKLLEIASFAYAAIITAATSKRGRQRRKKTSGAIQVMLARKERTITY